MAESDGLDRYLRQLREMGESELTFNDMSAARALNAARRLAAGSSTPAKATPSATIPVTAVAAAAIADARDWRAALIAAGGEEAAAVSKAAKSGAPRVTTAAAAPPSVVPRYSLPAPAEGQSDKEASRPAAPLSPGLEVHATVSDIFAAASAFGSLEALSAAVAECKRCVLHSSARNPVPGEGSATAELVCVGEGPGASEDETGRPFVGAAGKLLTSILGAIKLQREDVYICNVVKHRPPANRTPLPDEISACQPYLTRQLELIRPKVILALGTVAAQTLLGTKLTIGKLRGSVHRYHGIPLIVTYHPAALLRNPAWKRPTWEDVQHVRRILDGTRGA